MKDELIKKEKELQELSEQNTKQLKDTYANLANELAAYVADLYAILESKQNQHEQDRADVYAPPQRQTPRENAISQGNALFLQTAHGIQNAKGNRENSELFPVQP